MTAALARVDLGLDTSGRRILMTARMKAAYDEVCDRSGVIPTIVQGAFMAELGGGASASAGYHDLSGCLDTRVWNLTVAEQDAVIRAGREVGWAIWLRDHRHGMDPHMHWLLLGEPNMAAGAVWQEAEYRAGRDGLASRGPDYHWRPSPIPTFEFVSPQEDDMALSEKLYPNREDSPTVRDALRAVLRFEAAEKRRAETLRKQVAAVRQAVDAQASPAEVKRLLEGMEATIQLVVTDPEEKP